MLTPLIGREREMSLLVDCLDEAFRGTSNGVLCVGDPGIGKTRLAEELASMAVERGFLTGWGRAAAAEGAPPYWQWHEVLRALPNGRIAWDRLVSLGEGTLAGPPFEARLRRFDIVSDMLATAARDRPLVILLDDLHAADGSSQLLALHVARAVRDAPLLLLATAVETVGPVAQLTRDPHVSVIGLQGLSASQVAEQVTNVAGRRPTDAEVITVVAATAGNPFFVAELSRHLASGGEPPTVPRSVLYAIRRRLDDLPVGYIATLEVAAVLGARFSVELLVSVARQEVADCLSNLDGCARAGLLAGSGTPGEWRFAHGLVRDTILVGLDTARRVVLHRRAAEALEQVYADAPGPVLFDLARHWMGAAVSGDRAPAVEWLRRAGGEAMRQHAYEEGRGWFAQALALDAMRPEGAGRCRLKLGLASAQAMSADIAGALETCQEAVDIALRLGGAELVGDAALIVEPTFDRETDQIIRGLCEQALGVLGSGSPALRAKVLARYAVVCDHLSDLTVAVPAVEESLTLASECGDVDALIAAMIGHHMVRSGPDGLAERETNADRMAALGVEAGLPAACFVAAEWRFDAAFERGDLARAARELEAIAHWAHRVDGPVSRWRLLRCRAMLSQARGQLTDARRYGDDALATMTATGFPAAFMLHAGLLQNVCHHSGHTPETLAALGMAVSPADQDWPVEGIVMTLAPAFVLTDLGRVEEARRLYGRLGPAAEWRESPHASLFTWALGMRVAVAIDAADDVASLWRKLDSFRGHHIVNGRHAMAYFGPVELWLGIGSAHLGLVDRAVVDLESSVEICARQGTEGFRAESECALAAVLTRRSAPGDRARARTLADGAYRRATQLGMAPLRDSASALLERIDARMVGALTVREREVASLVAAGMTNREIATRLFLSERTAQNHVQHILDKLQLANRAQIAVWTQRSEYLNE